MGNDGKPDRGETVPAAHLLHGITRRPSLKRQYGHLFPQPVPTEKPAPRVSVPRGTTDAAGGTMVARMADVLLLAYVGLRGHLHAPGKVSLEHLLDEISGTLAETGTLLNWLPWQGGECPLPPTVEVEILWSDGGTQIGTAGEIGWAVPAAAGLVDLVQELRFVMFYRVVRW